MIKNKIITLILVAFATISNAQNTFTSKIVDSENNEVLIGATILLKGTTNGVNTNTQGSAILENIPNGKQRIIVSYIGYQEREIIYTFPQAGLVENKIKLNAFKLQFTIGNNKFNRWSEKSISGIESSNVKYSGSSK